MIKKLADWFHNMSFHKKIIILVFVVGVLPIGVVFTISLAEMKKVSEDQQIYALNQGYIQVVQTVEDKLSRAQNISTLLAVNDMINTNIVLSGSEQNISEQLSYMENITSYINGLKIAFESNDVVFYLDRDFLGSNNQTGLYQSIRAVQDVDWYRQLEENNGQPTWVGMEEGLTDKQYIGIARKIWKSDDYKEAIGALAVLIERKDLEEMLVPSSPRQIMYLETAEGMLLASNVDEEELVHLPLGERSINDREFQEKGVGDERYLVRSRRLEKANLYMVSLIPIRELEHEINAVNARLQLIYVIISLFILAATIVLTRSITNRILLLRNQMMETQKGIIKKVEEKQSYNDEIGQLIRRYNEMVGKVEELMQEQYVLGQEKTGAELKALQSQINPHFLYNTLDMINWMAQKNETENIRDVVQAMSKFYRLTLSKGRDIVTIGDEIKMCEAYMEIQKRRYRGKILYEVEVDDEIEQYLIPKITLQPFLENAIVHGINEKEDARGVVILNGWMEDGRITLSVTDDGTGMSENGQKKSHSGSHYGLDNISKRLELFYGEKIPVEVESSLGIGTCVVINVPARTGEEPGV